MAKRGPKPKPTALKLLEGTRKDRVNQAEPHVIEGSPECPDHLDAVAKAEFRRMLGLLHASGVLSRADGTALALYCQTYSEWIAVRAEVAKKGRLIETTEGTWKINPLIEVAHKCKLLCLKTLVEFGFTPSSRSRVTRVTAEVPQDDLEDFLTKRG